MTPVQATWAELPVCDDLYCRGFADVEPRWKGGPGYVGLRRGRTRITADPVVIYAPAVGQRINLSRREVLG